MSPNRPRPFALIAGFVCLAAVAAGCDDDGLRANTPTQRPTATATAEPPTATATATRTATATASPTPTASATPTPTETATASPTATPTPTALSSEAVLELGPWGVGVTTLTLVDDSRPTMANGTYPGAASRTLVTEIWYPSAPVADAPREGVRDDALVRDGAPYPLVVYSHGFMEFRQGGLFLARHLASHGYVVVSADYPLTNFFAPGGPNLIDVAQQPGDVSFLIDQMLAFSAAPDNRFSGAVDDSRIGLSGLSLGGLTTSLAAFHPQLRDPRVRAAAAVAGLACFFGPDFYADRELPQLILHGDIDAIVPYVQNAVHAFDTARAPKYLVTVHNASHTAFSDIGARLGGNNPDDFGCGALSGALPGPDDPTLFDVLGGAAAGLIKGDCPLPCMDPTPRPMALAGARQLELATLTVYPFFEAYLRDNEEMKRFLEVGAAAQNAEIDVVADTGD